MASVPRETTTPLRAQNPSVVSRLGAGTRPNRAALLTLAGCALTAVHSWGLWNYGATQTHILYGLFLLTLAPLALVVAAPAPAFLLQPRFAALMVIGIALLAQVWLQPTLTARGYVHAVLAWSALVVALVVATRSPSGQRAIVLFLLALGAMEALVGLVQSLGASSATAVLDDPGLAHGTLVNRNHFAGLLNLTLPLAVGTVYAGFAHRAARHGQHRSSEAWAWTWIGLLSLSLMGLAVLLSRSRGGSLILVATLILIAILLAVQRQKTRSAGLPARASVVLLALVLAVGLVVGIGPLLDRFAQLEAGAQDRTKIYLSTLELISDHPIVGVGPGMYKWRFRPYQTEQGRTRFDHAHNDYLETAAEWGMPFALLLWSFLVWRLWRSIRTFLTAHRSWPQGLALGCAGSIFSLLAHSLVDFSLQIPSIAMTFFAIVGLAWSLESWNQGSEA